MRDLEKQLKMAKIELIEEIKKEKLELDKKLAKERKRKTNIRKLWPNVENEWQRLGLGPPSSFCLPFFLLSAYRFISTLNQEIAR
ncbi:hypothetical protein D9C17_22195 (plasmid) [Bacillus subtilis subsp. subtilis]|uniref:hypothetical protein n=1 Tax=Bacillus subtilis TaxID=1423 RepID=UPI000EF1DCFF|nr:hypothetical protein [Bacillus subtilis]AYK93152.1 hypothetical protein D9C17_22195 [Bacillus subtilis subsp. subtilis]